MAREYTPRVRVDYMHIRTLVVYSRTINYYLRMSPYY